MSALIRVRDPSPPRPRTFFREPPKPHLFQRQVGCQVHGGGGHERSAGAESTVKVITYEAALLGPQEGDHLLGYRHLHRLGDGHRRDRGHPLGGSSSGCRSARRGLACSSTSSSSDESFGTCLEHARNVMKLRARSSAWPMCMPMCWPSSPGRKARAWGQERDCTSRPCEEYKKRRRSYRLS